MTGKVCIVTGATGGMGREITSALAHAGATVVIVCRDAARGEELRCAIEDDIGAERIEVLVGDLSRQADIRQVAERFLARHHRLHVLINNAGAHFPEQRLGPDGVELHLAINHLAGFLLTDLLLPAMRAGAPARIVNVVSHALADTRLVKIRRAPRPATISSAGLGAIDDATPMQAYGRSKLAAVMCGYLLAARLTDAGVTVTAVHPGQVDTGMVDAVSPRIITPFLPLVRRFLLTPSQGAEPAIRLAIDPALEGVTGVYFVRHQERATPRASYDRHLQEQLWEASQRLVGIVR